MNKILILNGPNLNMLGAREPEIYGAQTLDDIRSLCKDAAKALNMRIDFRQSNHEGELVEWIQKSLGKYDGLLVNAGAYTHTSIAIHDALRLVSVPVMEVHLSDPKKREAFRHHSYIEPLARAVFAGHGAQSYVLALRALSETLDNSHKS